MGGFKNELNNAIFENNLFDIIVLRISQCCKTMRKDCQEAGEYLYNDENKISSRLVARYLNTNISGLRFILENPEHYNAKTDTFKGRTDIKVVSTDWFYMNCDAYYIIEAKRLDGEPLLNNKYVSNGIARFVTLPSPKYSSYYGRNIMLGYIVQVIDVRENTKKIDKLQREMLTSVMISEMEHICDDGEDFNRYQCLYQADSNLSVELTHIFYDFSEVVK